MEQKSSSTVFNTSLRCLVLYSMPALLAAIVFFGPTVACADYGFDSAVPVAPFLNGAFPQQTPSAPGTVTWLVTPAFPNIKVDNALVIVPNPVNNRLYVGSRGGEIRSFINDQTVVSSTLFLDLQDRVEAIWDGGFLGMVFHPQFGVTGSPYRNYFYVYYSSNCALDSTDSTRVDLKSCKAISTDFTSGFFGAYLRLSRFAVVDGSPSDNPLADPASEYVMLNIRLYNGSHRGGGMLFGKDGYFYLTIGDQFRYDTAQDIAQTLEGGTFRLDLDVIEDVDGAWSCRGDNHKAPRTYPVPALLNTGKAPLMGQHFVDEISGQRYCIPADNPWVGESGVFEEYNSLGHRNPHRLAMDTITGRMWSGEVGEDTREEINVIQSGHNYGWPYYEGLLPFRPLPANYVFRGELTPPVIDFVRAEANAIIGGYVYRGSRYPELAGRYLAGDYGSGKIWAITLDEASMTATKEEIASFAGIGSLGTWGQDRQGEVYLGNVGALSDNLYQLTKSNDVTQQPLAWLSETGALTDMVGFQVSDFLVPYALNEPFWSDGALKSRWIAVPNDGVRDTADEKIGFSATANWVYPVGTVLMKQFNLALQENNPGSAVRLETRFLVLGNDHRWYGLTYRWLDDQSDARLLTGAEVQDFQITTADGGTRTQTWLFPDRQLCLSCHNNAAGGVLGPRTHQINGDFTYPGTRRKDNQLKTWNHVGMFDPALDEAAISGMLHSAAKNDLTASLETRARSYLDANCSYCHRPGTGNRAFFDMRFTTPLPRQGLINGGVIDNLELAGAHVITPGNPDTSVAYLRAGTTGRDAMPPIAKSLVDTAGVTLLREWILAIDASVYEDRALGQPAVASSLEGAEFAAAAAVDGDNATRWASAPGHDPEWIYVDLGRDFFVNHVILNWEAAYGKGYQIEVSADAKIWQTVFSETAGDGGIDNIVFESAPARYIRVYGTERGLIPAGYSLWDLEVYGPVYSGPPALASISVAPATATVAIGESLDFVAGGFDQYGAEIPVVVDWSISGGGTIDANGVFSAGQAGGPYTITARSKDNSAIIGTAMVSVSGVVAEVDTTPDAFNLPDVSDALLGSPYAQSIVVSGINAPAAITVSGGEYSVNDSIYGAAPGTVNNGDTVSLRVQSASAYATPVTATLAIGGVEAQFTVTTMAEPAATDRVVDSNYKKRGGGGLDPVFYVMLMLAAAVSRRRRSGRRRSVICKHVS